MRRVQARSRERPCLAEYSWPSFPRFHLVMMLRFSEPDQADRRIRATERNITGRSSPLTSTMLGGPIDVVTTWADISQGALSPFRAITYNRHHRQMVGNLCGPP